MERFSRFASYVGSIAFVAAVILYWFHALDTNPQYDNQVIWYATGFLDRVQNDLPLRDYFLETHKYPFLYVIPFIGTFGIARALAQSPETVPYFLLARLVTIVFAMGTLWVLSRLAKRVTGDQSPVILLLTSLLFLIFTSAVRPHIPVGFWTLTALLFAVRMREQGNKLDAVLSFGSAFVAFCTLQSGVFAFIFPMWGLVTDRSPKKLLAAGSLTALCIAIAIPVGYSFALGRFFGAQTEVGIDLGHNVGLAFHILHPFKVLSEIIGSSPLLVLFACIGIVRLKRRLDPWESMYLPIFLYIIAFTAIFIFHTSTMARFFMPVLPLLALLGAWSFRSSPLLVRALVFIFIGIMSMKLAYLAVLPNTYQQASAFLNQRPGTIVFSMQPSYFFTVPTTRLPASKEAEKDADTVIIPDYGNTAEIAGMEACNRFKASSATNEIVLLWNDFPWMLYHLLRAKALGPNFTVFCRTGTF